MAEEKNTVEVEVEGLFAFWAHDSFPFVLGGEVTRVFSGGRVEIVGYGVGHRFQPLVLLPVPEGVRLQEKLEVIRANYMKAQKDLDTAFYALAKEQAPFIKET